MTDLPKRLQKSLDRIRKCGGIVLIHHTSMGSVDFQLLNGGGAFRKHRHQIACRRTPSIRQRRSIRRRRTDASCGERMSFTANIEARLAEINRQIATAPLKEKRALQKERADLEAKLRKATA